MIAKSNVPWYNHDHAMHANGFGFEFRSTHSRETYRVDVKPAHTACMGAAPRMSVTVAAAPHFDSSVYGSRRTEMFTVVVWPSELDDDPSAGHSPASSLSPTRARVSSSAAASAASTSARTTRSSLSPDQFKNVLETTSKTSRAAEPKMSPCFGAFPENCPAVDASANPKLSLLDTCSVGSNTRSPGNGFSMTVRIIVTFPCSPHAVACTYTFVPYWMFSVNEKPSPTTNARYTTTRGLRAGVNHPAAGDAHPRLFHGESFSGTEPPSTLNPRFPAAASIGEGISPGGPRPSRRSRSQVG